MSAKVLADLGPVLMRERPKRAGVKVNKVFKPGVYGRVEDHVDEDGKTYWEWVLYTSLDETPGGRNFRRFNLTLEEAERWLNLNLAAVRERLAAKGRSSK